MPVLAFIPGVLWCLSDHFRTAFILHLLHVLVGSFQAGILNKLLVQFGLISAPGCAGVGRAREKVLTLFCCRNWVPITISSKGLLSNT